MPNTKYRSVIGLRNVGQNFKGDLKELYKLVERIRDIHSEINIYTQKREVRDLTRWHINQNIADFLINLGTELEFKYHRVK